MQTDSLLAALANMRARLMQIGGAYTADQSQQRLVVISNMREPVLREDADGFTTYCQEKLMWQDGDLMVDLLEELYEELGMDAATCMWDDFAMEYLQ